MLYNIQTIEIGRYLYLKKTCILIRVTDKRSGMDFCRVLYRACGDLPTTWSPHHSYDSSRRRLTPQSITTFLILFVSLEMNKWLGRNKTFYVLYNTVTAKFRNKIDATHLCDYCVYINCHRVTYKRISLFNHLLA